MMNSAVHGDRNGAQRHDRVRAGAGVRGARGGPGGVCDPLHHGRSERAG